MTGREEHKEIIENRIKTKLNDMEPVVEDFYYFLKASKRKSFRTIEEYIRKIGRFLQYIKEEKRLKKLDFTLISCSDIVRYLDFCSRRQDGSGQTSESYIAGIMSALNSFFNFLVSPANVILKNPCVDLEWPSVRNSKETTALAPEEIETIITALETGVGSGKAKSQQKKWRERDMLIFKLLLQTGMRVSELDEINIESINFDTCSIKVISKGGKKDFKIFDESLLPLIHSWIRERASFLSCVGKECDALFISNRGQRMCVQSINALVKKYTEGLAKNVSPHTFRRTAGTQVYNETKDIIQVQEFLGHSNVTTTQKYIKKSSDTKRRAAKIMSQYT